MNVHGIVGCRGRGDRSVVHHYDIGAIARRITDHPTKQLVQIPRIQSWRCHSIISWGTMRLRRVEKMTRHTRRGTLQVHVRPVVFTFPVHRPERTQFVPILTLGPYRFLQLSYPVGFHIINRCQYPQSDLLHFGTINDLQYPERRRLLLFRGGSGMIVRIDGIDVTRLA